MSVSGITAAGSNATGESRIANALSGADFLKLLVTELGNQDPLDPMDNNQLLSQLSEIRGLESSMQLTDSMKSLVLHSQMSNSSGLIGKYVIGKDEQGFDVEGVVESVRFESGKVMLQMGSHKIPFAGIAEVRNPGTPAEASLL